MRRGGRQYGRIISQETFAEYVADVGVLHEIILLLSVSFKFQLDRIDFAMSNKIDNGTGDEPMNHVLCMPTFVNIPQKYELILLCPCRKGGFICMHYKQQRTKGRIFL